LCCSVLQCVQCVAVCCRVLPCVAVCCSVVWCVAVKESEMCVLKSDVYAWVLVCVGERKNSVYMTTGSTTWARRSRWCTRQWTCRKKDDKNTRKWHKKFKEQKKMTKGYTRWWACGKKKIELVIVLHIYTCVPGVHVSVGVCVWEKDILYVWRRSGWCDPLWQATQSLDKNQTRPHHHIATLYVFVCCVRVWRGVYVYVCVWAYLMRVATSNLKTLSYCKQICVHVKVCVCIYRCVCAWCVYLLTCTGDFKIQNKTPKKRRD